MNWCQPHWTLLRETIKEKGLDQFGAKDAEEALNEIASQLEGNEEKFDPLLGSWSRINAFMAESLTRQGRGGELLLLKCPLCILVEDGQPELVKQWVDGCTEDARKYAIQQGLLKVN